VVAAQRGLVGERVHQLEAGLRTEGHRDRHGAVELDDRRAGERRQAFVQRDDPRPVGVLHAAGARVAAGDRGLQGVRAQRAAEPQRVRAQDRPDPLPAARCGVALVEDEIDHLEHRGQA
jgi:hypothetical protein